MRDKRDCLRGRPRRGVSADGSEIGRSGGPPGNSARPTSVSVDGTKVERPSTSSQRPSVLRGLAGGEGTSVVYRGMPVDAVNCGAAGGTPESASYMRIGPAHTDLARE